MKKWLQHVQKQILAGIIFMIPVFVVLTIFQKLWAALKGGGDTISAYLGLTAVMGGNSATVATALLLVVIFYLLGWLVRFGMLVKFRDWLEESVLQHIPGYLTYKAKMQDKLMPAQDERVPVMVRMDGGERPGLLIEENTEFAMVYFPNTPDSNNGQCWCVPLVAVRKLDMSPGGLIKAMQGYGRGIL